MTTRYLIIKSELNLNSGRLYMLKLYPSFQIIGCDGKLYSNLNYDQCGVCGGDNSSCDVISGNVTKQVAMGMY